MTDTLPTPLGHLVILHIDPVSQVSAGGLTIRDKDEAERLEAGSQIGTVVSLGPTAYATIGDGTPWVKPGDTVYFKRYAGIEYRPLAKEIPGFKRKSGELYRVVNDDDIFAIFPPVDEEIV